MDDGGVAVQARGAAPEVLQAGERRIARVESLRALAALGVTAGHAFGVAYAYGPEVRDTFLARTVFGGGFGVFLFFALSGYLLYWPFARRDFGGGQRIRLGTYARNRALRILPLYWISVAVLLVLQERGGTTEQWWHFLLLMQNFDESYIATVNGVLWSVIVEMHFYALLPLLAYGIARLSGGSLRRAVAILVLLAAVSLVIRLVKVPDDQRAALWRYNLPSTFLFFIPGMLLAFARLHLERARPGWLSGRLASPGLWLGAAVACWLVVCWRYNLLPLLAVGAFFAVGACVLPLRTGASVRALDWRPLVAVGVASYSLYIWHERLITHLGAWEPFPGGVVPIFVVGLGLSIAVAFASYRLLEVPFLSLRRRWSAASAPIEQQEAPAAAPAPAASA